MLCQNIFQQPSKPCFQEETVVKIQSVRMVKNTLNYWHTKKLNAKAEDEKPLNKPNL